MSVNFIYQCHRIRTVLLHDFANFSSKPKCFQTEQIEANIDKNWKEINKDTNCIYRLSYRQKRTAMK